MQDRGEHGVDVGGGLEGEVHGELGEAEGLPLRHLQGDDAFPGAAQAVAELEGLADEVAARVAAHRQRGGEVVDVELGHQRAPDAAEEDTVVTERRGGDDVLLDAVPGGPLHHGLQLGHLGRSPRALGVADRVDRGGGGGLRHAAILRPTTDNR